MSDKMSRRFYHPTHRTRRWLLSVAGCIAASTIVQSCCEVSFASEAESLARGSNDSCSTNHAQGLMSVKVSSRVEKVGNDFLQSTWNGALKTFVKPDILTLKSVESATGEPDSVRFVQLGGSFGRGVGVASGVLGTLFREGGRGSGLLGSGTITDIQEALAVNSPDPVADSKFGKISAFAGLEDFIFTGHPDGDLSLAANFDDLNQYGYRESEQWAPSQTHYGEAFNDLQAAVAASNPTKTVRVAVLDTGVDINHPDLKDVIDKDLAYNALTGKVGAEHVADNQGHGTHVAGIIAGQGVGGGGAYTSVLGIAGKFKVKIVPIKVLDDNGSGSTTAMVRGIRWATKKKVDVISMSLGSGSNYDCLQSQGFKDPAIAEAVKEGIIVVAAAGNESCPLGGECAKEDPNFKKYIVLPCADENVLCVASNDFKEKPSSFSNYSSSSNWNGQYRTFPDITAPGSRILSTYPMTPKFAEYQGVAVLNGTSMATPLVSGVAALLKLTETDAYPVTQATLKTYLQETMHKNSDYTTNFGVGRVDLQALLKTRSDKYINKTNLTPASPNSKTLNYIY